MILGIILFLLFVLALAFAGRKLLKTFSLPYSSAPDTSRQSSTTYLDKAADMPITDFSDPKVVQEQAQTAKAQQLYQAQHRRF